MQLVNIFPGNNRVYSYFLIFLHFPQELNENIWMNDDEKESFYWTTESMKTTYYGL